MQISHALAMKTQNRGFPLPKRVRNILKKYSASLLIPGAGEPVLGPELIVNGAFDTADGWSFVNDAGGSGAISGGVATLTNTSGTARLSQPVPFLAGRSYAVQWSQTGQLSIYSGSSELITAGPAGAYNRTVVATSSSNSFGARNFTAGTSSAIDNISVREILTYTNTYSTFVSGNYVESTGQTLTPLDGAVGLAVDAAGVPGPNLFVSPIVGAEWVHNGGGSYTFNSPSGAYSTLGITGLLASRLYEVIFDAVVVSNAISVRQGGNPVGGMFSTGSRLRVVVTGGTDLVFARFHGGSQAANFTVFNISVRELPGIHGVQATSQNKPALRKGLVNLLLNSNAPANQSVTCAAVPHTLAIIGTGSVTIGGTGSGTLNGTGASSIATLTFTPTLGSVSFTRSGSVTQFALFTGTVTAEQILAAGGIPVTTTAPASSAIGPQYWQFDGTDDRLQLSAVPFGTDISQEYFIVTGVSRGSSGATRTFVGDAARMFRFAPSGAFEVLHNGGTSRAGVDPGEGVPVICSAKYASGYLLMKQDAVVVFSGATGAPTVTVTNGFIGQNGYSTQFFNGAIHGVIFGKGAISDSELLTLERFLATLQGRRLP